MEKKENIINSMIISLAFVFNLFIFAPIEFYYLNIFDFWFPIKFVIPTILVLSTVIFTVLFVFLTNVKGSKRLISTKVLFGLFLGLYIQGNYLNLGYGQLDGRDVNWDLMINKGIINLLIWIIILVIFFIIPYFKKEKNFYKFSNIISVLIVSVQTITLLIVWLSYTSTTKSAEVNKDYYLEQSNIFNMSEEENIVFFMADSFEAKYFEDIIKENPKYRSIFSDFTFFENTTGCSLLTYMSMPMMLTGEELEVGKTLQENINNGFEKCNLYSVLKESGFQTEWYTDYALVPTNTDNNIITNKVNKQLQVNTKSKLKISSLLFECVLYKYMPHFLKPIFNVDVGEFNVINSVNINPYFIDDIKLNKYLLDKGMTVSAKNKTFKVIETNGIHYPFNMNECAEKDNSTGYDTLSDADKQKKQLIGTLKIFENYIEELKESGVYDNTTIIYVADHGFENRYNPLLMVKRKNEKHKELVVNNAPISLVEDFIPTIMNIATNSKKFGKDIYDYKEDEHRSRRINNYYFARDEYNQIFVESNIIMTTESKASDKSSYVIYDQIFPNIDSLEKEYKFGKAIDFMNNKNVKYISTNGILRRRGDVTDKGTTIGNTCNMTIKPRKTNNDVNAELTIDRVYNDKQRMIIKADDRIIYEGVYTQTDKRFEINFTIPKEVWNSNEFLTLNFEFPDASTYSSDVSSARLGTDWVQRAFIFKSIKFRE